ncbi:hypothetical protein BIV60_20490 [Bacillus sp. MUM 116]|uniref:hypothetical protein n=1 Tax=Bacillus sp. MUM 116 TaxID=1678002 RepID=UPI0008F5E01D|nr:hypothetical protein [Bacillus sp. MUM 116]OIK10602.1 hypothetical protein BIV60_20490 [Bacillus sp. MUM 116]
MRLAGGSERKERDGIEKKLFASYRDMLSDVESLIDAKPFEQVLTYMKEAKRIFIYGLGSSGLAAQELNYKSVHPEVVEGQKREKLRKNVFPKVVEGQKSGGACHRPIFVDFR